MASYVNPVPIDGYVDENDRMAREVARDAYRTAIAQLQIGLENTHKFGVQHVGGKFLLQLTYDPDGVLFLDKDTTCACARKAFRHQMIQMYANSVDTRDKENTKLPLFTYHVIMQLAYPKQSLEKSIAEVNQMIAEGLETNFTVEPF